MPCGKVIISSTIAALMFLQQYHDKGEDCFNKTIIGDETCAHYENKETKEQSK